jgi:thioredoxin-related protein
MVRICFTSVILWVSFVFSYGQDQVTAIYNPHADAASDIRNAVKEAAAGERHVLLQIGGNWCSWCIRFHKFIHDDPQIDSLLKADYVFQLVNYSKENKNSDLLEELGYPQRFGFPVLIVLDSKGAKLHTQNTAYLEKEKSYDREKVIEFLKHWSPAALKAENYK